MLYYDNSSSLVNSPAATDSRFGTSVAMNAVGDIVCVGQYTIIHRVYTYKLINNKWRYIPPYLDFSLNLSRGEESIDLNAVGNRLAIGAADADLSGGKVYVYESSISTGTWTLMTNGTLPLSSDISRNYLFGSSVRMNKTGDRLFVGAPGAAATGSGVATNAGRVYLYTYDNTTNAWNTSPNNTFNGNAVNNYRFGSSLATNGNGTIIMVGAPNAAIDGISTATNGGSAYIYKERLPARYCNTLAANTNLLVAGGGPTTTGSSTLAWSDDTGASWNNSYNGTTGYPFSDGICFTVAWNGSKWVAGGVGDNPLAYSFDGKTWQQSLNGSGGAIFDGNECNSITWNGTYWLAVGQGTLNKIAYSANGISWTGLANSMFSGNQGLAIAARTAPNLADNTLKLVNDSINTALNLTLGYNQQWYYLTEERGFGATYYNTTGKPICIFVTCQTYNSNVRIYVDGVQIGKIETGYSQVIFLSQNAIIPPGSYYSVLTNSGNTNLTSWFELR